MNRYITAMLIAISAWTFVCSPASANPIATVLAAFAETVAAKSGEGLANRFLGDSTSTNNGSQKRAAVTNSEFRQKKTGGTYAPQRSYATENTISLNGDVTDTTISQESDGVRFAPTDSLIKLNDVRGGNTDLKGVRIEQVARDLDVKPDGVFGCINCLSLGQ